MDEAKMNELLKGRTITVSEDGEYWMMTCFGGRRRKTQTRRVRVLKALVAPEHIQRHAAITFANLLLGAPK